MNPTTSIVLWLLALGAAGCAFLAIRLRRPPPAGVLCAKCSYSLEGIEQAPCPECKSVARRIEPSGATLTLRAVKAVWWWTCAVVLVGVPAVAAFVGIFGRERYTDLHTEIWPMARHYERATIDWRLDESAADAAAPRVTIDIRARGVQGSLVLAAEKNIRMQVEDLAAQTGVDVRAAAADGTLDELTRVASEAAAGQRFVLAGSRHTQVAMSSASSSASKPWVIVSVLAVLVAIWAGGLWLLFRRKPGMPTEHPA